MANERRAPAGARAGPEAPAWLLPAAREEWARVMPELERLERLSPVDLQLLAAYCQAFGRWREAEARVEADGAVLVIRDDKGTVRSAVPSPWAGLALKHAAAMRQFAVELGLSPASRGRAKPADKGKPGGVLRPFIVKARGA